MYYYPLLWLDYNLNNWVYMLLTLIVYWIIVIVFILARVSIAKYSSIQWVIGNVFQETPLILDKFDTIG